MERWVAFGNVVEMQAKGYWPEMMVCGGRSWLAGLLQAYHLAGDNHSSTAASTHAHVHAPATPPPLRNTHTLARAHARPKHKHTLTRTRTLLKRTATEPPTSSLSIFARAFLVLQLFLAQCLRPWTCNDVTGNRAQVRDPIVEGAFRRVTSRLTWWPSARASL